MMALHKIYDITKRVFDDLVVEDEDKNWKGICIAFLVISTIVSFIVIAIMILTPNEGLRITHPRITLEDIISDHYQPEDFSGSWISESELVTKNKTDGSIVIIDASTNTSRVIVSNTTIRQYNVKKFSVSVDKKFALLVHDIKWAHRYSQTAKYKIFNISNEHVFPLETSDGGQEIQYALFGPKGSQLVFVHGNNIYYLSSIGESAKQLTKTGKDGVVSNGIPDWMYGEKILRTDYALWFSPDGTRLAFVSFDNSKVASISYPKFGSYDDPNNIYPEVTSIRYPKAGRVNPEVSLWVVDLPSGNNRRLTPPSEIVDRDHYFTAFSWIDEDRVAAVWMRREQNYSVVSLCSEDKNWACERHLIERLEAGSVGWVELFDSPLITSDKRHYLLRLPMNDGDSGAFRQIAMITINGRVRNFLTQGVHDVTRVLAHRSDIRTVFYEATSVENPGERHIYSIPDIHSMLPRNPSCLTCNHSSPSLDHHHSISGNCSYHSALFSPNAMYYTLTCLGPMAPWTEVRTVEDNQIIVRLEPDKNVQHIVDARAFPSIKTIRLPLDNKFYAEVSLLLPPGLRESDFVRFPLVMEISSSPGEEGVSARLTVDWGLYLSSKRDFIYARVQARSY